MRTKQARIVVALSLVTVAASLYACTAYRYTSRPLTDVNLSRDSLASRVVALTRSSGTLTLRVERLEFPYLFGTGATGPGVAAINPADVREVREADVDERGRTVRYRAIDLAAFTAVLDSAVGRSFEFRTDRGRAALRNVRLTADRWLEGEVAREATAVVRADLRDVAGLSIREVNGPMTAFKTTAAVVGAAAAVVAVVAIIVALTKESCPFVYVDDGEGWRLVGEAYAGAAFRSTQRHDLLPLPVAAIGDSLFVRLRNEARETQYTDQVRLVVVDHPSGTRALSTFDGSLALVGTPAGPLEAHDTFGRDAVARLAAVDGILVETTAPDVAASPDSLVQDAVTARFALPRDGAPVLEVVAGNTTLLDLTFGRFFAAMGDRLATYLAQGNEASSGARINAWREREGVDLVVELQRGDRWEKVAVIPTVGPAALRTIAVPLPIVGTSDASVVVRVRSGVGFWRVDRLSLSARSAATPRVARIAPALAEGSDASDQRGAVDAVDGTYNALSAMNESMDMSFALPAPAPAARREGRSVFLSTSGYYNVHPPIQSAWLPGTLKTLRDEPGSLARFGRDLARVYQQMATARP